MLSQNKLFSLFEKTIYENNFGTVGVCVPRETQPHLNPLLEGEEAHSPFQEKAGMRLFVKHRKYR